MFFLTVMACHKEMDITGQSSTSAQHSPRQSVEYICHSPGSERLTPISLDSNDAVAGSPSFSTYSGDFGFGDHPPLDAPSDGVVENFGAALGDAEEMVADPNGMGEADVSDAEEGELPNEVPGVGPGGEVDQYVHADGLPSYFSGVSLMHYSFVSP